MRTTQPTRTRVARASIAVVIAAALVVWLVARERTGGTHDDGATPTAAAGPPASASTPSPAAGADLGAFGPGLTYLGRLPARFALTYDMRMTIDAGESAEVALSVTAEVELVAGEAGSEPRTVVGRLRAVKVEADPAARKLVGLDIAEPARGFELPFVVSFEAGRGVTSTLVSPDASPGAGQMIAVLASRFSLVPGPGHATRWVVGETDLNGDLQAHYERASDRVVTKVWHMERGKSALDAAARAPVVSHGQTEFVLDARGRPSRASYTGDFDIRMNAGAAETRFTSRLGATLTFLDDEVDWSPTAGELAAVRPPSIPKTIATPPTQRGPRPAAPPAELARTAALATRDGDWKARRAARDGLVAAMEADPAVAPEMGRWLAGPLPPDMDLRTIVEALLGAKSPAALATVVAALGDGSVPAAHRQSIVSGATFVARPDPKLVAAVRTASLTAGTGPADEVADAALLAYAGIAHFHAETDAALRDAIEDDLLTRARDILVPAAPEGERASLAAATNLRTLKVWLDALGNLGGADVLPYIEPHLGASSYLVRRAAVDALRFVPTAQARLRLARIMAQDGDGSVREVAIGAAQYQPQAAMEEPVLRALETDALPGVRLAAASALARWGYVSPILYERIARVAEREPVPEVKQIMLSLQPKLHTNESQPELPPGAVRPAPAPPEPKTGPTTRPERGAR